MLIAGMATNRITSGGDQKDFGDEYALGSDVVS
jgi:hypothetical protein